MITSKHDERNSGGPWLDYPGAAERTSLSESYLRKLVMDGKVPHKKVGRRVLFSVPALDEWINHDGRTAA